MIIDTHCHLDHELYTEDVSNVLERAREKGLKGFIIPGADPENLPRAIELCENNDDIYFAIGVHPYDLERFKPSDFEQYSTHPKCIAIGECGLDYYRLPETPEEKEENIRKQKEVFEYQIQYALNVQKPLIIHIRDASLDSKALLEKYPVEQIGGVLHCFNADEQLLSLARKNFYYGIGGVLTFKNARKLVQVLPKIPKDKLIIETDSPYLTPHPNRGKRNEPAYTTFVAEKIGELLEMDYQAVCDLATTNSKALFKGILQVS